MPEIQFCSRKAANLKWKSLKMRAIKTFTARLSFLNFLGGDPFDHKIEVSVAQFYNKKCL